MLLTPLVRLPPTFRWQWWASWRVTASRANWIWWNMALGGMLTVFYAPDGGARASPNARLSYQISIASPPAFRK